MGNQKEEEGDGPDRVRIIHYGDAKADDPLRKQRGRCLETNCDVRKYFLELRACDKRVTRKIKFTAETCQQEVVDLMMSLDRCVKHKAFTTLR